MLLFVNAIFYRLHFGTFLRPEKRLDRRQPPSRTKLWLSTIMVLGFLAGVSFPMLAPAGPFAVWLAGPYSQITYFAWCFLAPIVVDLAISIRAFLHERRRPIR
jgi:hypothetical protein